MSRPEDLQGKILSSSDIADMLGVNRTTVSNWKTRGRDAYTFPEPICTINGGKTELYWHADVAAFIRVRFGNVAEFILRAEGDE